ncbi:peptide-methionine (S)-S-oxide reductase MsrA [Mucilaginibacter gotjawali]|uniref:Peptide methionine sulfoxide reductase MsrA n=2 Tax=Mucilaginibacter gotjawali TaxID=1550579 RepID=A0A125T1U5_9SPHI|nr:peptide-methionine (S)-S-oxide reductase MsrA [Mucilaginibacter gotjawali]MBB3054309.1 peptide-methionine (S)-S-oxide reductase [Mucilaginibacter gotjawali]BAU51855.1 Peptide methionine sulfoxide reductase MsrA 2 [Mucilaginibacter gotjawali]
MKALKIIIAGLLLVTTYVNAQTSNDEQGFARLPEPKKGEKVATFAGGCFWSLSEGLSELNGVNKVVAGYAGGTVKNPSYEQVCTKTTGHAETVQVYYNPEVISYATLAEAFFYAHDPTTPDRQGPDEGPDYRSVAFYRNPEEKQVLEQVIARINKAHHYSNPIVTKVQPFKILYPAENYHQGYFRLHGDNPYIQQVSLPKVLKLRKAMGSQLKPEFRNS